MNSFSKNPSNIAQAAGKYVAQLKQPKKAKKLSEEILELFIEALKQIEDLWEENEDGEFLLNADWEDISGGSINEFLDYWLQAKFMGRIIMGTGLAGKI